MVVSGALGISSLEGKCNGITKPLRLASGSVKKWHRRRVLVRFSLLAVTAVAFQFTLHHGILTSVILTIMTSLFGLIFGLKGIAKGE